MGILSNLEPRSVFAFFEEICAIPHGSGNTAGISQYLVEFAKARGLKYIQDEWGNVIIWKNASFGSEGKAPVMLQGHMDMVAVKKPESAIDMKKEGLRLKVEGDDIFAQDTSLGGDDGIAVAYELALLDSKELAHPPLECVFTVDEEIGLLGAKAIDLSECKSKRMINLDSEEEGIFLVGCAGGMRVDLSLPVEREEAQGVLCEVSIGGLQGGHSGVEIHKERGNSNHLAGRFLLYVQKEAAIRLVDIRGGLADNAIPRETTLQLLTEDPLALEQAVKRFEGFLQQEYSVKDPGIFCRLKAGAKGSCRAMTRESTKKAAAWLGCLPNGVQAISTEVDGLVETSLNLGLLESQEERLTAGFSLRSSFESAKYALRERLFALTESLGGSGQAYGDYPGWAYRKDSPLRDKMAEVYQRMYARQPEIQAIHAGLECGFFVGKIPQLDCVSMGPDMKNIHTTEETMSIASVARTWEFLCRALKEIE